MFQLAEQLDVASALANGLVDSNSRWIVCPEVMLPVDTIFLLFNTHLTDNFPDVLSVEDLWFLTAGAPNEMCCVWDDHSFLELFGVEIRPGIVILESLSGLPIIREVLNQLLFLFAVIWQASLVFEILPEMLIESEFGTFDIPPHLDESICAGNEAQ